MNYIEEEIGNVKKKQDGEIKEKENKIKELEQLLNECQKALVKKKEDQADIEEQFRVKLIEIEGVLKLKDQENQQLKVLLVENGEEMKYLVQEVEKERRQAKENIAKLQQIFK